MMGSAMKRPCAILLSRCEKNNCIRGSGAVFPTIGLQALSCERQEIISFIYLWHD